MADVEGFEWVTEEQEVELQARFGADWPTVLTERIEASTDGLPDEADQRIEWLDRELQELQAEATVVADVTALQWVTAEQQAQLAPIAPAGTDWTEWLPGRLDEVWPEWRFADAGTLTPWLDTWLPSLAEQPEPDQGAAIAATDAPDTVQAALREALADVPGAEDLSAEQLQHILADLTAEVGGQATS